MRWHVRDSLAQSPASLGLPAHRCGRFPANRNALLHQKTASHLAISALLWGQREWRWCLVTYWWDQANPPSALALPWEVSGMGSASPGVSEENRWPQYSRCSHISALLQSALAQETGWGPGGGWGGGGGVTQPTLCCPGITPRHPGSLLPTLTLALLPL